MKISKVLLNETSQIDLTENTAEPQAVQYGIIAHTSQGNEIVGSADFGDMSNSRENDIVQRTLSGTYSSSDITIIRRGAFAGCASLVSVDFPNVSSVGSSAFTSCASLITANFPSATYIGSCAFSNCGKLSEVNCSQAEYLGNYAFFRCYSLPSLYAPSVSQIGAWAFEGCSCLSSINAPDVTNLGNNAFKSCWTLPSVSFSQCTTMGSTAFQFASSLTSVYIPKVTNLQAQCFDQCISLSKFDFSPVVSIGKSAFYSTILTSVHCPVATNITGVDAFRKCLSIQTAVFEETLTNTQGYLFESCTSLSIYDGNGRFAGWDLSGCASLSTIILRKPQIALLGSPNAFTGTPFDSTGTGGTIYIPKVLYDHLGDATVWDYKSATNWSTLDGYGNITWAKIESSPYEEYFGDGVETIFHSIMNSDGTPKDNTWDYEWDYTDGLLSSNGWKRNNSAGTTSETLVSEGVQLSAGTGYYIYMTNSAYQGDRVLMEVYLKVDSAGTLQNSRLCVSNGVNGIQIYPAGTTWRYNNSSSMGNCQNLPADFQANADIWYKVRLLLYDSKAYVWIDGTLVGTCPKTFCTTTSVTSTAVWAQGPCTVTYKSIKLKKFT